jgi:hypothetical protein
MLDRCGEAIVDGVGGGLHRVDGSEGRIEAMEHTAVEHIAVEAIDVYGIVQVMASRANVVHFQHCFAHQVPLNAHKPVINHGSLEIRIYCLDGHPRAQNPALSVQTDLQPRIHGIAQIGLGVIAQAVGE